MLCAVAAVGLASALVAQPAATNPTRVLTTREWHVPTEILKDILPAGDLVFFYTAVELKAVPPSSRGGHYSTFFQLNTKTGACSEVADLLPASGAPSKRLVSFIQVAPDGRHALICAWPSPSRSASGPSSLASTLYVFEIGKEKANVVDSTAHEPLCPGQWSVWRDRGAFFVTGIDAQDRVTEPQLYDLTGKKVGSLGVFVTLMGVSDDGNAMLAYGDPNKLKEPSHGQELAKTGRTMMLDRDCKIITKVDAYSPCRISFNGKYFAGTIPDKAAASRPATRPFLPTVALFPFGEKQMRFVECIHVGKSGDMLGVVPHSKDGLISGDLVRWSSDGAKKTLLEGVRCAAVGDDTLYYVPADTLKTLKAVKLADLK